MAYTDIIHEEYNVLSAAGGTLQFAFDSPISQDGSPHMEQLIIEFDLPVDDVKKVNSNFSNIFNQIRLKTGSDELINYTTALIPSLAPTVDEGLKMAPIGYMATKVGGCDDVYIDQPDPASTVGTIRGYLALPLGISASVSHRMNWTIQYGNLETWTGSGFTAGSQPTVRIFSVFGTSLQAVLYGSGQQFDDSANATRTAVIFGKQGWNMLGVTMTNATAADELDEIRVRNGQFRALKPSTWRLLNGDLTNGLSFFDLANQTQPQTTKTNKLDGQLFIDLRKLSAGANAELDVTSLSDTTRTYYPLWVAPIGAQTGTPPRQTASTKQDVTGTVLSDSYQ